MYLYFVHIAAKNQLQSFTNCSSIRNDSLKVNIAQRYACSWEAPFFSMFNASKFQLSHYAFSIAISLEVRRVLAVQYKLFFSSDDFIKIIQIVSLAFGQLIQTRGQRSTLVPAAWFWCRRTA